MTIVNNIILERAYRVMQIAIDMAEKGAKEHRCNILNRLHEIQIHHEGYASLQDGDPPKTFLVATGNWNAVTTYSCVNRERKTVSVLPSRIAKILEINLKYRLQRQL